MWNFLEDPTHFRYQRFHEFHPPPWQLFFLIHDRSTLFTKEFLSILESAGVKSVRLPPRSPNLNAFAERFVRSIKEECLSRMILIGEGSLRRAVDQFCEHYHGMPHETSTIRVSGYYVVGWCR